MKNSKITAGRLGIIYFVFCLISLGIIFRILYLQLFTESAKEAEEIAYSTEELEAHRGDILAFDGKVLASSVPYYKIRIDCMAPSSENFENEVGPLAKSLSSFFKNKSASAYEKELRDARANGNRYKLLGNRDVDQMELQQIKQFPLFRRGTNRGGFIAQQRNKRKNPYDRLAYRTIGFINQLGEGVGIELSQDFYLKGIPGKQILQRIPGGETIPLSSTPVLLPQDGYDVVSTLDVGIQAAAESALRDQLTKNDIFEGGTAVVMDVATGAIRAIANMHKTGKGGFDESFNYAIAQATNPGSTFKLVTLVALLEDNLAKLSDSIATGNGRWRYGGHTFTDVTQGGYGTVSLLKAFEKSSNVGFAKIAVERYGDNEKKYVDRILNMKLGNPLDIELRGEGSATIHSPEDRVWSKLSLPMMAMGYEILLTPMHTLTFYNAIANGGKMVKPYFIEELRKYGQTEKRFTHQVVSNSICSRSTIRDVHKALRGVVTDGTAKSIFKDAPYAVSGKTGTAQIVFDGVYKDAQGYRKHQASFAGFFPSENPKYSMIVVLYTGKTHANFYGGTWAAPVFRSIADYIFINNPYWFPPADAKHSHPSIISAAHDSASIKAQLICTQQHCPDSLMPNLLNLNLSDAMYILESKGINLTYSGYGKVRKQNPAGGEIIQSGQIVNLELEYK